jgi:translation initiation factor 4G
MMESLQMDTTSSPNPQREDTGSLLRCNNEESIDDPLLSVTSAQPIIVDNNNKNNYYGTTSVSISSTANNSLAMSSAEEYYDSLLSLPLHSDFTVPMSNQRNSRYYQYQHHKGEIEGGGGQEESSPRGIRSPPPEILTANNNNNMKNRRSIFNASIQQKYGCTTTITTLSNKLGSHHRVLHWHQQQQQQQRQQTIQQWQNEAAASHSTDLTLSERSSGTYGSIPFYRPTVNGILAPLTPPPYNKKHLHDYSDDDRSSSPPQLLSSPAGIILPSEEQKNYQGMSLEEIIEAATAADELESQQQQQQQQQQQPSHPPPSSLLLPEGKNDNPYLLLYQSQEPPIPISPLQSPTSSTRLVRASSSSRRHPRRHHPLSSSSHSSFFKKSRQLRHHETRHAQSLLLGFAFAAVWSSSNLMAPNLSEMAVYFGLADPPQRRDLYLGSYCALAVSVASLPIAGTIGLWTDIVSSRKLLYVATILGGGVSAIGTAYARNFRQLWMLRWINGGFMAGSVPVAFSFLGDLFDVHERNAASSGLTALMGAGIILGQVYAGTAGMVWSHAFIVSGSITIVLGILCWWLVREPVRGGKEIVLRELIESGNRYERKLTPQAFRHAVISHRSNAILLWQGFFSSLPWGIIFVFLNDFLSQERGFSVPDATFLVAVFGFGCAMGGILGGYFGQELAAIHRSYLPLFMAVTTILGILPFVGLLNSSFPNAHGFLGITYAILGGLIPSLPSVNVRPCLINVNPPESRGASLTTANLLINLGRGVGPCCITLIQSMFQVDRKFAFNVTVSNPRE